MRKFTKWGRAGTKTITVLVLIAVNLMPLAPVFAQEATDTPSGTDNSIGSSPSLQTPNVTGDSSSATGSTGSVPVDTTNTDTAPTSEAKDPSIAPLAAVAGSPSASNIHGDDEVNAVGETLAQLPYSLNGALQFSYPFSLPPGRTKLTPSLSLQYSSQPDSGVNVAGRGWSFSIPFIRRLNHGGIEKMYSQDYFYSSYDGDLASSSPTGYAALSDSGAFNKYTYSTSTNVWIMTDKFGTVYTFGTTTAERQDNPNNPAQVYQWMLSEIRDTNNNFITFTYTKDGGQIYPNQIVYTGNGSSAGIFEVDFLREARTDSNGTYAPGFYMQANYRTNEVDIKVNGAWVTKYLLGYTTGDNQTRSLLNNVTQMGRDDLGNTITLPATTYTYQQSTPGWTATSTNWDSPAAFTEVDPIPGTRDRRS